MADPHPEERERLRRAVVAMAEAFVTRDATAEQLSQWAGVVERFCEGLEGAPPGSVFWGIGNRNYFAVRGLLEPPGFVAPPSAAGDVFSGVISFGEEHAGHHGFAHGGSIAQAFDFLLSSTEFGADTVTYTSELTVRFLKPVPLHRQAVFETVVRSRDQRSATIDGRALVDGVVHAEATARVVFKRPEAATAT